MQLIGNHFLDFEVVRFEACAGDHFVGYTYEVDIEAPATLYFGRKKRNLDLKKAKKETIDSLNYEIQKLNERRVTNEL